MAGTASIGLFQDMIVDWKIPLAVLLLTGLLTTPLSAPALEKYGQANSYFLKLVFNVASFGGMLMALLIALNYYVVDDEVRLLKGEIQETGYLNSGGRPGLPWAEVRIGAVLKSLTFPHNSEPERYRFVEIGAKSGLLGFDIIVYKRAQLTSSL